MTNQHFVPLLAILLVGGCSSTVEPHPSPAPASIASGQQPAILTHLGEDTARAGDPAAAAQLFRSAARAAPDDPAPLVHLGNALIDLNDPERAEQAFRGALALASDNPEARRGLAVALVGEGRAADALPILRGLDNGSEDPRILRAEGAALDMLGQSQAAEAVYRRGLQAHPTDPDLHGNLALSLALAGDAAGAMMELRAALAAPEPDPRQNANAVLVLALIGRTDEARARGEQTIGHHATKMLLARVVRARASGGGASALGVLTSAQPSVPPAPRTDLPPVTGPPPATSPATD